ncbi:MAG: DUF411 domain-containing protein [Geminicoccaceae bacterium]
MTTSTTSVIASAFLMLSTLTGALLMVTNGPAHSAEMTVLKSPWCGCCAAWVRHIRAHGFTVRVRETENLTPIKRDAGVGLEHQSCHTAMIDGYAIEGHVPAADVKRLLAERSAAKGLAVPGMPIGSPGMEQGSIHEPYAVILFGGPKGDEVFARHE